MAKQVSILTVFVASPDDVSEDRDCLEEVIRELNLLWAKSRTVRLELVRWETHAYPGFGEDAQSVINEQIKDDFDIFIGLLWKKFGTPTKHAGSGTEEEFNRVYNLYRQNQKSVRIMVYFKTTAADLSEIDPDQLNRIRAFQTSLGPKGGLYWQYKDTSEFASLVRMHLTRQVDDWGKEWGRDPNGCQTLAKKSEEESNAPMPTVEIVDDAEEEEGFLDLVEIGTECFGKLTEQAQRIVECTETLGKEISERTEQLQQAQIAGQKPDLKKLKKICNYAAENLDRYTTVMNSEVPIFGGTFRKAIDAYARAISILPELQGEAEYSSEVIEQAREVVVELIQTIEQVLRQMSDFRTAMANTPRMTTRYNRSKRKAVAALDAFIKELKSGVDYLRESEKTIDSLLPK